jgi:hypothetical protein
MPIVSTTNTGLPHRFKQVVLVEREAEPKETEDEVEALLHRVELERSKRVLDVPTPEAPGG